MRVKGLQVEIIRVEIPLETQVTQEIQEIQEILEARLSRNLQEEMEAVVIMADPLAEAESQETLMMMHR